MCTYRINGPKAKETYCSGYLSKVWKGRVYGFGSCMGVLGKNEWVGKGKKLDVKEMSGFMGDPVGSFGVEIFWLVAVGIRVKSSAL